MFKKATRKQAKLRLLLDGASGSGKTFSALILATNLGKKVCVIDTEKGSASLYAKQFDFDTVELMPPYSPERYIELIKLAEKSGCDVLIIDSITHEWNGSGGCLEIQDKLGGKYQDWGKVTPRHDAFIETILQSNMHIIATARSKMDHAIITENGKTKVEKLGMKTEQRDNVEYEFTSVLRLNQKNMFTASKDRTGLFIGKEAIISASHAEQLINWLNEGEQIKEPSIEDSVLKVSEFNDIDALNEFYRQQSVDTKKDIKFLTACSAQKALIQINSSKPKEKTQEEKDLEEDYKRGLSKEPSLDEDVPQ